MSGHVELIRGQQQRLREALARVIAPCTPCALVDFPDHSNVGDSAIWLGEIHHLQDHLGLLPRYVCKADDFDAQAMEAAHPEGPILIHGGGNFGDIWPKHQHFREMLMGRYPGRRIVQLPQSISFSDPANLARCARAIEAHGDFHLFVRDRRGHEFAKAHLPCPVHLVPDMAFALGSLDRIGRPVHDVFMLLREDPERSDYDRSPLHDVAHAAVADWVIREPSNVARWCRWRTRLRKALQGGLRAPEGRCYYFNALAEARVQRGLRMLSSGRVVVTDRLHAHILSTLLGVPNIVLDNNYGKIHGYMDAWTSSYKGAIKVHTAREAVEQLHAVLERT